MKKIVLSLAAIAALSTAAFADNKRTADLRDLQPFDSSTGPVVGDAAFKAADDTGALTAYERMMKNSIENNQGRH